MPGKQKANAKFGRNAKSPQNAIYKSGRAEANKARRIAAELRKKQKCAERKWQRAKITERAATDPRLQEVLQARTINARAERVMQVRERWLSWKSKLAAARKALSASSAGS